MTNCVYVTFIIYGICCVFGAESIKPVSEPNKPNAVPANLVGAGKPNVGQVTNAPTVAVQNSSQDSGNTCTCGVFLSDQFVRGSSEPPKGYPPIAKDIDDQVTCNASGVKQCISKCVESLVSFMPKSGNLICGIIDRDCFKQRAFLFVNNCNKGWFNTKFSAGREYCCKNGEYYKCPL